MDVGTGSLEESLSQALGVLPDIRLHGSLVLCALVIAWLALVYRRAHTRPPTRRHRRKTMSRTTSTVDHGSAGTARAAQTNAADGTRLRVRWGRTALAALVLAALITSLGTGIAAAFGAGTLLLSASAALFAVAGLAGLRALAVRDRTRRTNRRIEQAFGEAMNPPVTHSGAGRARTTGPRTAHGGRAVTEGQVFDAAGPDEQPRDAEPHTRTDEDRAAAGAEGTEQGRAASVATPADGHAGAPAGHDQAALPTVPRPTYLDAATVEHPVPAPLERPEQAQPSAGVTLKSGVSAEYRARLEAKANRTLDLDKVLERRRAV